MARTGRLSSCSWGRWRHARGRLRARGDALAAWASRAPISARPTSARSPARGRCVRLLPALRTVVDRRRREPAPPRTHGTCAGRRASARTAARNGAPKSGVDFPDADDVRAGAHPRRRSPSGRGRRAAVIPRRDRALVPRPSGAAGADGLAAFASGGGYDGPARVPAGQADATGRRARLRPDGGGRPRDGVALIDHERASAGCRAGGACSPRHPDPKWVAPPGHVAAPLATELDLGPPGAYGWLAANATRFGFLKRYSWEPWHFGYTRNPARVASGSA